MEINGRKYALAFYTIITASAAWILPPVLTFFWREQPLVLMTAVEWISICSSTLLFYSGANLVSQHLENQTTKAESTITMSPEVEAKGNLPKGEK